MSAKKDPSEKVGAIPPFGLRMLPALKAQLERAAQSSGRSLNSEIVKRLEESLAADSLGIPKGYWELPPGITAEQINEAISEANKRAVSIALTRLGITERPLEVPSRDARAGAASKRSPPDGEK